VWDNGVTDGVSFVPPLGTTTYTVTGTDANGCVNTDQVNVTVNPLPNVNAGPDQTVCDGAAVTLSGSGAVTYVWDNGVTDGVSFVPPLGTTTYNVTGTDANGCVSTDQVDVLVNPLPVVDAGNDQTLCEGTVTALSGSGAVTYAWDNGVTNGTMFTPPVGTTTYTVTGTDANGCVNTDQVDIHVDPLPLVDAGPNQSLCEDDSTVLYGSGAVNYDWSNGVIDGVPFVQPVGTVTYTVAGTDVNGCTNLDQVSITVNPLPIVDAGQDTTLCEGTSIIFSVTGTSNLTWDNGVVNGVPFTQPVGTVDYTVYDSLPTGCTATDQVSVTVNPLPVVSAYDIVICPGDGVTLEGQGATSYSWTGGVIDGVEFFPTQTTTYEVTGTNNFGCESSATAQVVVLPGPTADFDVLDLSLSTTSPGTGFTNLSSNATTYEWTFGDGTSSNEFEPYHDFPTDEAGSYEVILTVTSPEGCVDERIKYVYVTLDYTIYVPNAFTPDNNGVNEVFKPVLDGFDETDYTLYIFNRWGELVFESHDMNVGWDGEYSQYDKKVQDGVFTWKIEARIKNSSDTKIFVGHASILK
ncbi:MAG: gliding motility-associated C-terminal domain-containing protein, partial [Flavobacteriales bacterium]|nr:gliding motility-associated C-terminal domain-containing protein [Flavobacteriales bacterium]